MTGAFSCPLILNKITETLKIEKVSEMNKHMREEHEKMNRGRHKEQREKKGKNMSDGYADSGWGKVQAMLTGKHPTTNIATNEVSGRAAEKAAFKCIDGGRKKFAAGGVGKMRHESYN
jgi:hypothetical protein